MNNLVDLPPTSPLAILIPYKTILAIVSINLFEIKHFFGVVTKGKIVALIQDLKKLIASFVAIQVPDITYATTYLISFTQNLAISTIGGTIFAGLTIVVYLLSRSQKQL